MKKIKNKKSLVALLLVALFGTVGVTFAYFTSTDTFESVFSTKPYKMEVVETFESPDNWVPGTTTSKSVVAEEWKDALGNTLPLKDAGDNFASIINFASDWSSKWTKSTENGTDYYYYKTKLAKNASTSSLIESVTFNPNVTITTTNNCVENGNVKTCTTTTGGYAGGTYKINIKVETVQLDQYKTVWGTNVTIN